MPRTLNRLLVMFLIGGGLAISCNQDHQGDAQLVAGKASPANLPRNGTGKKKPRQRLRGRLPQELRGGNWHKIRPQAPSRELTKEQQEEIEKLGAIGYLSGSRDAPEIVDVTVYDAEKTWDGVNFYTSGHGCEALLTDMRGNILHRWSHDYNKLWPHLKVPKGAPGRWKWRKAHLYPNGDILAIHEGIGMIKLDKDSNLLWEYPGRAHHDMHVMEDGTIYVLTREAMMVSRINKKVPVMDDFIVRLDADGKELTRVSVLESIENGRREDLLRRMPKRRELFHTNSLEVLDGKLADRVPAFKKGNVLISILKLDVIAVVDLEQEKIVWAMEGDFKKQHHPTVLENGNILLFDNEGGGNKSFVHELDPADGSVLWSYDGTSQLPFYSKTCGSCYRLPNGNTLITESEGGRALEVTPEKEIVWEYFNPHRGGDENQFIAILYDLKRFGPDFPLDWVDNAEVDLEAVQLAESKEDDS